jgi:hypothetical protein
MNKTLLTSALTLITVSIVCGAITVAQPAHAGSAAQGVARAAVLPPLPPSLIVPDRLPRTIHDPLLLAAWVELYNHTDPIPLWEGRTTTGRELAQFLLDQRIPVVWDVDNHCGGSSCSVHTLTPEGWVYTDETPAVNPIYVRTSAQTEPSGLLMILAHEIFHRTEPFGLVRGTKFEEYWAFRVGAAVDPSSWPAFDGYDPMVSGWLFLWLRDNNLGAYYPIPDYPPSIELLLAEAQ